MASEIWRLRRVADDTIEPELFDVEVTKSVNRFARQGVAFIDDNNGEKWEQYPRGTAVEFLQGDTPGYGVDYGTDYGSGATSRLAGWIAERREADRSGADTLELNVYSFDHFLRRQTVDRDFSGKTISTALEEIIKDFSPVSWNASKVAVQNDATIERNFDGLKVDSAIEELASKSAGEQFGVDDDIEFFFEPRTTGAAPRGIDNSQWVTYDIPERGKKAINEIEVFYGTSGNKGSVVVRDGSDQQDLESKIGTASPVTLKEEATFEEIDNATDAREKGEEILENRNETLSGTVTTYGLYDATPGQVIPVTIDERGIDTEFRIAELTYLWGEDTTEVVISEKRGQQDDDLVRLTDTLKRVEQRAADRSTSATQYEGPIASGNELELTAEVLTRSFGTDRFNPGLGRDGLGLGRDPPGLDTESRSTATESTAKATEDLLNALRDGWSGETPPQITTASLGTGTGKPRRTDGSLEASVTDFSATVVLPDATTARFDAAGTVPGPITLEELGLETSGGTLHGRLTTESLAVDDQARVDVQISVAVSDNPDLQGVITTTGSTVSRDIIADNNPATPTELALGTSDDAVAISDTSLTSQQTTESIDSFTDRQVGEVDVEASTTNGTGSAITFREWGLKNDANDLLSHLTIADLVLEDGDTLTATQRLQQRNV